MREIISGLARATVSATSRRSLDSGTGQPISRSKSPSLPSSPEIGKKRKREYTLPPSRSDPSAFPSKVLRILEEYLNTYVPFPMKPDDFTAETGTDYQLEEHLPPVLALLGKAAAGSDEMRTVLKDRLLPSNMDRSTQAAPLETRPGVLGDLLRLMQSSIHLKCRDTAGELLWAVCGGDAALFSHEIGYGNAAGLLFHRGISQPPPAHITEIPPAASAAATAATSSQVSGTQESEPRHPITSLAPGDDSNPALEAMTQEEREREAERLFVLFDRMEKNPVISARSGADGGQEMSVKDAVRQKMEEMDGERFDADERRREEEEERREEEEAMRDLEAYRRRKEGRK